MYETNASAIVLQVFITYVMRQFEFIEEGQVASPQRLIAAIFNFLIMLSYEKYNSRTIVATPKIIQLCEGIMASGQDPVTHGGLLWCIVCILMTSVIH